ncbi:uroporphyrinogen decarboxylase family protein [Verrucomicrobiota bacterium]
MNSRERILATWKGEPVDHVPLTTWCFGLPAHPDLKWERDGVPRPFWYTLRLEHLHTLPHPWTLADDVDRVRAWKSLGVDDMLEISVPWSVDPDVTWTDTTVDAGVEDPRYPVMIREYRTPSGPLRHAVRKTGEQAGPGWVVQPDVVPLIEDFNIPRGVDHAVTGPADVKALKHLYTPPDETAQHWFTERAAQVAKAADTESVPVQAWAGFGMDAVVWFAGAEGAVFFAVDHPDAFGELMNRITETDLARAELAAAAPGIDIVAARGWYSSTDFWSPGLFDAFVYPYIEAMAEAIHTHGKTFGYVMTTGVETLGPRLADAGVDVLYFVDPVQDTISLAAAAEQLGDRMTLAGGINTVSLKTDGPDAVKNQVRQAIDSLAPTGRFILHPVDALFPDTPWQGIETMLDAWREAAGVA